MYVPINAAIVANSYTRLRIELVLKSLLKLGLTVCFQAAAANGYWAVPLVQEHMLKTAFGTHRGQFHYLRMRQGLSGPTQAYTRLNDILVGPILELNKEPAYKKFDIHGVTFLYFMDDDFGAHHTYKDQWRFLRLVYFLCLA